MCLVNRNVQRCVFPLSNIFVKDFHSDLANTTERHGNGGSYKRIFIKKNLPSQGFTKNDWQSKHSTKIPLSIEQDSISSPVKEKPAQTPEAKAQSPRVLDLSSRICRFYSNTLYNSGEMKQSPANANYDSDEMTKTNTFWGKKGNNIAQTSAKYLDSSQTMRLKTQAVTTRADLVSITHRTPNHMPSLGRNLRDTDQSDIFGDRPLQIGSFPQNFLDNECRSIRDTVQDLDPASRTPKYLVSDETGHTKPAWVGQGSLSDFKAIKPTLSEESSKKKQPSTLGMPLHAIKKANAQKKISIKTKIKTDLDVIAQTLHQAELARITESMSQKPRTQQKTRKSKFCFRKDDDAEERAGVYNLDYLMRSIDPTMFDKIPPWLKPRLEDFNDYYDIDEEFV